MLREWEINLFAIMDRVVVWDAHKSNVSATCVVVQATTVPGPDNLVIRVHEPIAPVASYSTTAAKAFYSPAHGGRSGRKEEWGGNHWLAVRNEWNDRCYSLDWPLIICDHIILHLSLYHTPKLVLLYFNSINIDCALTLHSPCSTICLQASSLRCSQHERDQVKHALEWTNERLVLSAWWCWKSQRSHYRSYTHLVADACTSLVQTEWHRFFCDARNQHSIECNLDFSSCKHHCYTSLCDERSLLRTCKLIILMTKRLMFVHH